MSFIEAIILGIVEGITEFLPVSSTGHLILTQRLLALESTEFLKSFSVAIQLGAILAVFSVYGRRLLRERGLWSRIAVAFLPTAVFGAALYPYVRGLLDRPDVVLWAMGLGGIVLIVFEKKYNEPADAQEDLARLPFRTAAALGVAQTFAFIPGVSRSAATIVGGLMLGLSRRAIVEFSFLLAIPTMAAATGLDILTHADGFVSREWGMLAVGFLVSWAVAWWSITWLLKYIRAHDFTAFGVYRIVAALLMYLALR